MNVFCTECGTGTRSLAVNRWRVLLAVTGILLSLFVSVPATEPPAFLRFQVAKQLLDGADQARDEGNTRRALVLYRQAADLYTALADAFPGWEAGLTQFRIGYCRDQIRALEAVDSGNKLPPGARAPDGMLEDEGFAMLNGDLPVATDTPAMPEEVVRLLAGGQVEDARPLLLQLLRTAPDDAATRTLAGILHCLAAEFENAILVLEPVVAEDAAAISARAALSAAYAGVGRHTDAIGMLQAALQQDSVPALHYNMAQFMLMQEPPDLRLARVHYHAYLQEGGRPDDSLAFLLDLPE